MSSRESRSWSEHPDLIAFYSQHRNDPDDLYPSERRFLSWLAGHAESVLDIGCAAGGFSNVWRHYNKQINYVGVDVSASLIEVARKLHPDLSFFQGDCVEGLSFPARHSTVVSALGWLHWERRYKDALKELWRLTDRYLFFDLRVVDKPEGSVNGKQQITFLGGWDGKTTTPYVTVSWSSLADFFLEFAPLRILAHGYWGKPAETVMNIHTPVCFAAFVLEKKPDMSDQVATTVCLDLPLPWPEARKGNVAVLPATELARLAPQSQREE